MACGGFTVSVQGTARDTVNWKKEVKVDDELKKLNELAAVSNFTRCLRLKHTTLSSSNSISPLKVRARNTAEV